VRKSKVDFHVEVIQSHKIRFNKKLKSEAWYTEAGILNIQIMGRAKVRATREKCQVYINSKTCDFFDTQTIVMNHVLPYMIAGPGRLVLHAGAVARAKKAIVIAGISGMGKSTLVSYLAANGFKFLSDEIVLLKFKNKKLIVYPSFAESRLSKKSVKLLGSKLEKNKLGRDRDKYVYQWPDYFLDQEYQLFKVLILSGLKKSGVKSDLNSILQNAYICDTSDEKALSLQYKQIVRLLNSGKLKLQGPLKNKRALAKISQKLFI
jgi:hypothetical protein